MKYGLALVCSLLSAQTYTEHIAPILFEHCVSCHRPGEAAPFSLLDYQNAKAHARQIAAVTRARLMPPWKPEPGKGDFEGERRLTEAQLRTIEEWVGKGAPEGDPSRLSPPPKFAEGWQLGAPDLIVRLDRAYELTSSGPDVFRNFILRVPLDRTRFVKAVEIRPGRKSVVHHANLLIDRTRTLRLRDGKDGAPGFPGMDARIETRSFDPESHFLFWKPGTSVLEEPEDMAWQLDPGTDLVLNMHLQPSGKPESIQPSVGLYFTDKHPAKRPMLLQLEQDGALKIEPGRKDFVVTDALKLPVNVDLLAIYPHAHYLAKDIQAFATLPDGTNRWLIHIRDWDINWQAVYRYRKPMSLPKGTVITMCYTYDNSSGNPRNPSRPPIRVVNGDRSIDEMAHLWLQVIPQSAAQGDPRIELQRAILQRRVEKYPADFFANFSLGALLQTGNHLESAITHYRKALRSQPSDAIAHNALGTALLAAGRIKEATTEFQNAIRAEPNYADPRYNLARVLLSRNQLQEAIEQLREAVRIQPDDAPALSDLGAALLMTGQAGEGFRYLKEAVQCQPDYFNGRYNLGQALASAGKRVEAEAEFREALRLKPGDRDTIAALRVLRRR